MSSVEDEVSLYRSLPELSMNLMLHADSLQKRGCNCAICSRDRAKTGA